MRKVELLPTRDSDAGYGRGDKTNVQIEMRGHQQLSVGVRVEIPKGYSFDKFLFEKILFQSDIIPKSFMWKGHYS